MKYLKCLQCGNKISSREYEYLSACPVCHNQDDEKIKSLGKSEFTGKAVSMRQWVYWELRAGEKLSPVKVAIVADRIMKKEEIKLVGLVASLLGYQMKLRVEVSDYKYRKNPKIKIAGNSYTFLRT